MPLNLKEFYNRVIKNQIPYCMVCLRTQKERYLTNVKRYNLFAKNCIPLKAQGPLYNYDNGGLVCRTCDGWLRRGLQVMNAVVESKNANYYFSHLSHGQVTEPPVLRYMESTRSNWSLTATETLVISSDNETSQAEPQSTVTVTHEKDCVVIIEHDIGNAPATPRDDVHSIVTLDDSDEESKKPQKAIPKELPSTLVENGLSITPLPPSLAPLSDPNMMASQGMLIPVNLICPSAPQGASIPNFCMPFNMSNNTDFPQQPFMISGIPAVMSVNNCDTATITGDIVYDKSVIEIEEVPQPEKLNGQISQVFSQADNTDLNATGGQNEKKELSIFRRKRRKQKTYPRDDEPGEKNSTDSAGEVVFGQISPIPEVSETDNTSIGNCSKRKYPGDLREKAYRYNKMSQVIEVSESSVPRSFVQVPKEPPGTTVKQNVDWEDEIPMDVIAYHGHSIQFRPAEDNFR